MVLSNIALLAGIKPQEFLDWMREVFIDAADWVMVPNVIGMGMHSDGGQMMTKPYISGGSYISKMSNYCKGCAYDPKSRTGENACPFTNLYWNFLSENQERFARNHRMFQQLNGLRRLKDLAEVKKESGRILDGLSKGII
jgi:deoxyribodipyrimidine photolyase-related protein